MKPIFYEKYGIIYSYKPMTASDINIGYIENNYTSGVLFDNKFYVYFDAYGDVFSIYETNGQLSIEINKKEYNTIIGKLDIY